MSETEAVPLRHHLVVTDDGERDINVEHDANCPFEDEDIGFGVPHRRYLCDVGIVVSMDGLEATPAFAELPVGRHEIETWNERRGAPWFEADGGLRLVEVPG